MSIQSELLTIVYDITTVEPIVLNLQTGPDESVRWANTLLFNPGLFVSASLRNVQRGVSSVQAAELRLITRESVAGLRLSGDLRYERDYDDPYARLFLDGFRAYLDRPHSFIPAGLSGLVNQPPELHVS